MDGDTTVSYRITHCVRCILTNQSDILFLTIAFTLRMINTKNSVQVYPAVAKRRAESRGASNLSSEVPESRQRLFHWNIDPAIAAQSSIGLRSANE